MTLRLDREAQDLSLIILFLSNLWIAASHNPIPHTIKQWRI